MLQFAAWFSRFLKFLRVVGVIGAIARLLFILFFVYGTADNKKADNQNNTGNKCEKDVHLKRFNGGEIDHVCPHYEDSNMHHHRIFFWENSFFNLPAILHTQRNQNHQQN